MPENLEFWQQYVSAVAERYKGKVSAYEIWNEPDLHKFFEGTPSDAAQLTNTACSVIRRVDPAAKVISSSISHADRTRFARDYLAKVESGCLDVIGVHLYTGNEPPEVIPRVVTELRSTVRNSRFAQLPIWNTEAGWLIQRPGASADPGKVGFASTAKVLTEDEAVGYLLRAHVLTKYSGVDRFYFYAWDNAQMGLGTPRLRTAYAEMVRLLLGSTLTACTSDHNVWRCGLKDAAGHERTLIWNAGIDRQTFTNNSAQIAYSRFPGVACGEALKPQQKVELGAVPIILCKSP